MSPLPRLAIEWLWLITPGVALGAYMLGRHDAHRAARALISPWVDIKADGLPRLTYSLNPGTGE